VKRFLTLVAAVAIIMLPHAARAQVRGNAATVASDQQNVPPAAQRAQSDVEDAVKRFRIGVQGGVGLDPEIIDVGVHAAFGPLFNRPIQFRPGIELGAGEVTTLFGINLDVLYTMPGTTGESRWRPYVGAGPNFALSHRGFETDETDKVDTPGTTGTTTTGTTTDDEPSRFDFSDTDFNAGMNFIVGMRKNSGVFFEMKATAWGVSNIRLLAGFNF
jgi:hypothetical protein